MALRAMLSKVFGERRFGESSSRLVIPSYDCVSGKVHIFKTAHHADYKQDYLESAVDVAMATSAAPTYFPAHIRKNGGAFIDGGIWANCPVMVGFIEATCILKADPSDVRILSIGTTEEPFYVTEKQRQGGILSWSTEQMQVDAEAIGNGKLYVIDERCPRPEPGEPWDVWEEDLIGEFDVKDGFIVNGSYRRNPAHRVLSSIGQGFMQSEEELMRLLVSEFNGLPEPEGDFIAGEFGHIQ